MSQERMTGGCACGHVRFRINRAPMITHCCHCRSCQRETGSAFAVNTIVETSEVEQLGGDAEYVTHPSASGRGHPVAACPKCHTGPWSHYSAGKPLSFIRVGTLDDPTLCPPDVHIYTSTRQPWVTPSDSKPTFENFYDPRTFWTPETAARWTGTTKNR